MSYFQSKFGKTFFSESVTIADGKSLNISDNAISGAEKITGLREELDSFRSMEGTVKSFIISTSAMNNDKEFPGETMTNLNLSNKSHLTGMNFSGSTMSNSNFSNSNVSNCNFNECDLTGCNFRDANISDATFSGATLTNIEGKSVVESGDLQLDGILQASWLLQDHPQIRISGNSSTMLIQSTTDYFNVVKYDPTTKSWGQLGNQDVQMGLQNTLFDGMKINDDGTKVFFTRVLSPFYGITAAFQYNDTSKEWVQIGALPSTPSQSIGINKEGTRMVLGYYFSKKLTIYKLNDSGAQNTWEKMSDITQILLPNFGYSVCMSSDGNTVVGLSQELNGNSATSYVYTYQESNQLWTLKYGSGGPIITTDHNAHLVTLSPDGTFLAMSSINTNEAQQYTTVFHLAEGTWSKVGKLSHSVTASSLYAEVNFSKSNKTLYYSNGQGHIFVYAIDTENLTVQLLKTIRKEDYTSSTNTFRTCTINQLENEELGLYIENNTELIVFRADLTLI